MAELHDPQPGQTLQKTAERDMLLLEAVSNLKPSLLKFRVGDQWERVAHELKIKHGYDCDAKKLKRRMTVLLKDFTLKIASGQAEPKDKRVGKELLLQRILARKRIEEKEGPPKKSAKPKPKSGIKKGNNTLQLQSEINKLKAQVSRMQKKEAEKKKKLEEMKVKMAAILDEAKTKMTAAVEEAMEWTEVYNEPSTSTDS